MTHDTAISVRTIGGVRRDAGASLRPLERIVTLRLLGCDPGDIVSRIFIGALFLALAVRIADNAVRTGRMTGLLLVASEALVVVLMVIRRPSAEVDRRWRVRLIAILSIAGPPLVRPLATPAGGVDTVTAVVSALGLTVVVISKLALGRSFGVVPANRGVVSSGPYRLVRHPIYLGYIVTHVAFVVANPLTWNLWVLGASDVTLMLRALYEEQTLAHDTAYLAYQARVRWRILPGLF